MFGIDIRRGLRELRASLARSETEGAQRQDVPSARPRLRLIRDGWTYIPVSEGVTLAEPKPLSFVLTSVQVGQILRALSQSRDALIVGHPANHACPFRVGHSLTEHLVIGMKLGLTLDEWHEILDYAAERP